MSLEIIPLKPGYRYVSVPFYKVTAIPRDSGYEDRNRDWAEVLYRFDVTIDADMAHNIPEVHRFFHAHGGTAYAFNFKDLADWLSCDADGTPTPVDQPTIQIDATHFQLVKDYNFGSMSVRRHIYRPIRSTILMSDEGVLQTSGYAVNRKSGIVSFTSPPMGEVRWGGGFYCLTRFVGDFPVDIVDQRIDGVKFSMQEQRPQPEDLV